MVHRGKRRRQESWYGIGFLLPPHSKKEHCATEGAACAALSTAFNSGYFGAHAYERVDAKGMFHTEWEKCQTNEAE